MTPGHGPDHLGPAGYCNCGKVGCCLSFGGDCLCEECACQETRPRTARPVSAAEPVPPITAAHYLDQADDGHITVFYTLYGNDWSAAPYHGPARLGTTALAADGPAMHAGAEVEVHYTVDGFTAIERHTIVASAPGVVYLGEPLGTGLARMCLSSSRPPLREETYAALRRIIPPGRVPDDPEAVLRQPIGHMATARPAQPGEEGRHGWFLRSLAALRPAHNED